MKQAGLLAALLLCSASAVRAAESLRLPASAVPVQGPAQPEKTEERAADTAWRRFGTKLEKYTEREWRPDGRYQGGGYWVQVEKTREVQGWIEDASPAMNPPARVKIADVDAAIARGRAYLADKGTAYGEGGSASYWGGMTYEHLQNRNAFVPISALVAEALRDSPEAAHRAAAAQAAEYVRQRAGADYPRAEGGVLFSPYRMAYGMFELLKQPKSDARDAQVRSLLDEIKTTAARPEGFRYSTGECSGKDEANFQLALLSLAVSRAKASGFEIPKVGAGEKAKDLDMEIAVRMGRANAYYAGSSTSTALSRAARSPICELARMEAGCEGNGQEAILSASNNFTAHTRELLETQTWGAQTWKVKDCKNQWADTPHNPNKESVTSYYLLFGLYWYAKSLEKLPPLEAENAYHRIGAAIVYIQRPDNSWLDSPTYAGPNYGTASAVATLLEVKRGLERAKAEREKQPAPPAR